MSLFFHSRFLAENQDAAPLLSNINRHNASDTVIKINPLHSESETELTEIMETNSPIKMKTFSLLHATFGLIAPFFNCHDLAMLAQVNTMMRDIIYNVVLIKMGTISEPVVKLTYKQFQLKDDKYKVEITQLEMQKTFLNTRITSRKRKKNNLRALYLWTRIDFFALLALIIFSTCQLIGFSILFFFKLLHLFSDISLSRYNDSKKDDFSKNEFNTIVLPLLVFSGFIIGFAVCIMIAVCIIQMDLLDEEKNEGVELKKDEDQVNKITRCVNILLEEIKTFKPLGYSCHFNVFSDQTKNEIEVLQKSEQKLLIY